jgi:hypothetical protein
MASMAAYRQARHGVAYTAARQNGVKEMIISGEEISEGRGGNGK